MTASGHQFHSTVMENEEEELLTNDSNDPTSQLPLKSFVELHTQYKDKICMLPNIIVIFRCNAGCLQN
jgi:hypothetical protein